MDSVHGGNSESAGDRRAAAGEGQVGRAAPRGMVRSGMVRDPVCGAQVNDQGVAWHTQYRRQLYWFCSAGCRKAFERKPDRYANEEVDVPSRFDSVLPALNRIAQQAGHRPAECGPIEEVPMSSNAQHGNKREARGSNAPERRDEVSKARVDDDDLRSEIAERAYARYLSRGADDGHALEDWLEAEQEVRRRSR